MVDGFSGLLSPPTAMHFNHGVWAKIPIVHIDTNTGMSNTGSISLYCHC